MHCETSCCRISKNYSRLETLLQKNFKVVYEQLRFSSALFSMLFAGYKMKGSVQFRSLTPCLILSYLPISSHLILFSFLFSLSSFLDFPILRTSLDISTLITYIFLEIKTLEYWVTLALSQSRRKESSSLPQVSICFYHYFLQKLYTNVNNIKHSKCTNFQFFFSSTYVYIHIFFLVFTIFFF